MAAQGDRWQDVGVAIRARMTELRMKQAELVRASGVSDPTVRDLMRGTPGGRHDDTLWKVSVALRWPQDAIHRILAGEPVSASAPAAGQSVAGAVAEAEEIQRRLEALEARLARLERSDPPPSATNDGSGHGASRAR